MDAGRPETGRLGFRVIVRSTVSTTFAQRSSASTARRKGSPMRLSVGRIALNRSGRPATNSSPGTSGTSTKS
jgi:hypothetical protein